MAGTTFYPLDTAMPPDSPAVSSALLAIVVAVLHSRCPESPTDICPEQPIAAPKLTETLPPLRSEKREEPRAEPVAGVVALAPSTPALAAKVLPIDAKALRDQSGRSIFCSSCRRSLYIVFDGIDNFFCPLAIGEVEEQLAGGTFLRVHRSHLVI